MLFFVHVMLRARQCGFACSAQLTPCGAWWFSILFVSASVQVQKNCQAVFVLWLRRRCCHLSSGPKKFCSLVCSFRCASPNRAKTAATLPNRTKEEEEELAPCQHRASQSFLLYSTRQSSDFVSSRFISSHKGDWLAYLLRGPLSAQSSLPVPTSKPTSSKIISTCFVERSLPLLWRQWPLALSF